MVVMDSDSVTSVEKHAALANPTSVNHFLESLFFSMSVYEPSQEAVLRDLERRFGPVQPLMSYGLDSGVEVGHQVVFVARSQSGRVIVSCRGTCGMKDVLQDLKYMHSRLSFAKGTAHWGFVERAESVPIDLFLKLLDGGEEITFTGHSMGGAVASLLALRVLESKFNSKGHYEDQVRCITFGTPLFASNRLAEMINTKYKDIFIHIVSRRDLVPKIMPWVSTLQKLVYDDEDHLEGLVVLKCALSFVPWLPIAPFLSAVESRIPGVLKFLFRCIMKLALPSGLAGSYAFAGHIVMIDTVAAVKIEGEGSDHSVVLTSAEELNAWHSQLNFAFGSGFDVAMIEEHMLDCYYDGIVRAFSRGGSIARALSYGAGPARDSIEQDLKSLSDSGGKITVTMISQGEVSERSCELQMRTPCATLLKAESFYTLKRTLSGGEAHLMRFQKGSGKRLERASTMGANSRNRSCTHEPARWAIQEKRQRHGEKGERRCRACQCLRMYMNVSGSCKHVTKKFLNWGWMLGVVGKVARHLKILDELCTFTFIRLVMRHILG